ncbi:hypothetical protein ACWPM1_08525 [Tsuneonella sp. HG249]
MTGEFEYSLSQDDLVRAFRLMGRRKGSRRVVPLLWIGMVVCVIALALLIGTPARLFANPLLTALAGVATFLFALLVVVLLAAPAIQRRAAHATLSLNPNFEGPITVSFDDQEFRHHTAYSTAAYPWAKLYGWRADDRVTIVQPAPRLFFVVPHQILGDPALAALHDRLADSREGRLDV